METSLSSVRTRVCRNERSLSIRLLMMSTRSISLLRMVTRDCASTSKNWTAFITLTRENSMRLWNSHSSKVTPPSMLEQSTIRGARLSPLSISTSPTIRAPRITRGRSIGMAPERGSVRICWTNRPLSVWVEMSTSSPDGWSVICQSGHVPGNLTSRPAVICAHARRSIAVQRGSS